MPEKVVEYAVHMQKLEGEEVQQTIEKKKKDRSNVQNGYYWGCVLEMTSEYTGFTDEECHQIFRKRFLKYEKLGKNGKRGIFFRSTTDLKTGEFEDYLAKIRQYMAKEYSLIIPLPNEVVV